MSIFTFTKSTKTLGKKVTLIISCQYCLYVTWIENETKVKFTLKIDNNQRGA